MAGETYPQKYVGGFKNRPDVSTPADAAFLNAVESALMRLLGEDPAADEVGVWVPASDRFVFRKIANANVDAAAAIARSKLDFGAGLVNADIAAAAAIAKTKLNLAGTLGQAEMAAGNKVTWGLLANGPPANPSQGDIWIASAVTGNEETWVFWYNTLSASAHKWQYIGGVPLYETVITYQAAGSVGAWIDLATQGPDYTLARAGEYLVSWGADHVQVGSASNDMYSGISVAGASPAQPWTHVYQSGAVNPQITSSSTIKITVTAGQLVRVKYLLNAGNVACQWGDRWMRIEPMRIS